MMHFFLFYFYKKDKKLYINLKVVKINDQN